MKWKNNKLSEISRIGDGAHASLKRSDFGIPYLTAKNITKSGIDYTNMNYISEETYNKHFKEKSNALTQPKKADILYSIIGSIGGVYVVRDGKIGISSSVAIFRADIDKVIPQYLAYFLKSSFFDAQIQAIKGGVAQGFMSLGKLGSVNISYPDDIEYQKRIVSILSAYDTLIENNQKQIKLLEEAAQRLYKEWFVDLRFPGYEDVKIVDGVPEGWSRKQISDVCFRINAGGTPSRSKTDYWNNPSVKWYKTGELQDCWLIDSEEYISEDGLKNSSAKVFPKHTIIMAIYASPTLGRLGILSSEAACNQAALCLIANEEDVSWQWLYHKLYELRDEFNTVAKGAGQQNISADVVKKKEIIVPSTDIMKQFTGVVSKLFEKRFILQSQSLKLGEARDRLLPKLMNGEIEIRD